MADMQLTDFKSYEFAPRGSMLLMLIEQVNDAFLRRAFRFAVQPLNASVHLYAGDLFDHLREADSEIRADYLRRFQRIFPTIRFDVHKTDTPSLFAEGNHDVGLGSAYSPSAQSWYLSFISPVTFTIIRIIYLYYVFMV